MLNRRRYVAAGCAIVICACTSDQTDAGYTSPADTLATYVDTAALQHLLADSTACQQPPATYFQTSIDRIAGIAPWSDGRVAVVDAREQRIVVFDRDGKEIRRFGRKGAGPGEFSQFTSVARWLGDSIAITDAETLRLTVFSDRGDTVRMLQLTDVKNLGAAATTPPDIRGLTKDGNVVALSHTGRIVARTDGEMVRDTQTLNVFRLDSRKARKVRTVFGGTSVRGRGNTWVMGAGFWKGTAISVGPSMIGVSDNAATLIDLYRTDGTHMARLNHGLPQRTVTAADVEEYRRRQRENVGEFIYAQNRERMRWDTTHAALSSMRIDDQNHLWLRIQQSTYAPWKPWVRIDTTGRVLGCAVEGTDWRSQAITGDELIFTHATDAGEQVIRLPAGTYRRRSVPE